MSTNLHTDSFTYTRSHKHAVCLSIFSGTCNDPVLIIAYGPPQCRIIHTPPPLAVYGSSVLDGMHKKGNRNILSRKKKADFENYGSLCHVNDLADPISAYRKAQRDCGKFSCNRRVQVCHRYLQVAVLIRRVNGNFQLMTANKPVPMQEETGADKIISWTRDLCYQI